jgi:hypothetical protein
VSDAPRPVVLPDGSAVTDELVYLGPEGRWGPRACLDAATGAPLPAPRCDALAEGAPLYVQGICKVDTGIRHGDMVAVFTLIGEAVSMGTAKMTTEEMMAAKEGQAMDTVRVVMEPGIYPKEWKKHLNDRNTK